MRYLLMWKKVHPTLWRKGMMALVMVGATMAAFYWGRLGGAARVDAQQVQPQIALPGQGAQPQAAQGDYARRVVAYIYDNVPITREELGEFLIARFGKERVEFLITRRIVERHCQAKGIFVTDLEVENQFRTELKELGNLTPQDFTNQILNRFNKSLYEWKEDVIRPKLLMAKLCRPMVEVT